MVFAAYKVSAIESPTDSKDFVTKFRTLAEYDSNAGYKVYHLNNVENTW
jgi:hypothetical protein